MKNALRLSEMNEIEIENQREQKFSSIPNGIIRVDQYSYQIDVGSLMTSNLCSHLMSLDSIHENISYDRDHFLNAEGSLNIKEFTMDSHECRCDKKNTNRKQSILFK